MKNKTILSLILVALIITQTGCSSEADTVSVDNYYLDTTCNITVYGTGDYSSDIAGEKTGDDSSGSTGKKSTDCELDKELAEQAIDKAYELCAQMEKKISKTIPTSDISRINEANGEWVEVCDWTAELINKGIEYGKLSGGDFDITVGGVTALWDFHAVNPVLPDESALAEAVRHVGYQCIQLDGNKVRLTDASAQLDLGGIAKGYIGDKMAECLIENGVNSAIVNLGGNIICIGDKPDETGFTIGIETPYSDRSEISGKLVIADKTAVTSGVYERYFELDGKKYHHILSTKTGYPVDTDVVAVTLVADLGRSVDIDALGTICLIKGADKGLVLIESIDGIEACFTKEDGSKVLSSGMEMEEV